jgi:hypothetical protein
MTSISRGRLSAALLAPLALASLGACATLPQDPEERALYVDLRRVIEGESRTQWLVDRVELEEIANPVLRSTCQARPAKRLALRAWLDERILAEGGPAREAYRETKSLDGLEETLSLERVRLALDYGQAHLDDCPFWLEPDADFRGVHADTDRFILLAESNSGASLTINNKRSRPGGGGSGRVMVGWGVSDGLTLATGAEFGGRGLLSTRPEDDALSTLFTAGIPLLARFYDVTSVYDLEVAAVAFSPTRSIEPRYGGRAVFAAGVTTVRLGAFMPLAMLQVAYDVYPSSQGEPLTHIVQLGTRVSLDADF